LLKYFLRRILLVAPTMLGITLVTFLLVQVVPGGPVEMALQRMKFGGGEAGNAKVELTEDIKEQLQRQYGFDKPIHVRYVKWLGDLARLDFGDSYYYSVPVTSLIVERLPVSLTFGVFNFVLVYLISIPLGIAKAVRNGTRFDAVSSATLFSLHAIPPFSLGVLMIVFLCGGSFLDWFPLQGLTSENFEELSPGDKILDYLHHITLPLTCYVVGHFAIVTMMMRNSLLNQLSEDYKRTAEAKGLSQRSVIYKHCLRNAMIPIASGVGQYVGLFLAGSLLIEQVFGLDGIGRLSYESLQARDYPVALAIIVLGSFATIVGNLVSDVLYVLIDPRIDFA
jgi:microcin C transport system permease protein